MRKLFLSAVLAAACVMGAMATDVTITMNAISTTMKLTEKTTGNAVAVGEPDNKVYNVTVEEGTYLLTGYDTDGTTVNGTMELNIAGESVAYKVFTITTYATNADWVYGTDYTINLSVVTREGTALVTTLGDSKTEGRKTFLALEGNTYFCDLVPTAAHADNYAPLYKTGTINYNANAFGAIPESLDFTLTVPEGATAFVGRKKAHFVSFIEIPAASVDGQTYHYTLAKGTEYNFRVSKKGALTNGGVFNSNVGSIVVSEEDLTAKDPKWIDHDVKSNGGYNVADIFLNINAQEHLKLNQGDTYDILALRNWEVVNNITANYFIEPDYTYTVTDLDGNASSDVVTIDADGTLHAVGNGAAIVTVIYDAMHLTGMTGGEYWSAIWPENTGVFVVTVGDAATGIDLGMTINETNSTDSKMSGAAYDADFDVFYFLDTENGYNYTFKPTNVKNVKVAYPTIGTNAATYSGFGTEGVKYNEGTGEYTVTVKFGRQIVQLTNEAGVSEYQVLVGKPVHVEATAAGRQQTGDFFPGDNITVQLSGLYHPANKLAGIYNFNAMTVYKHDGAEVKSKGNQYTFCSAAEAQAVTVSLPEDFNVAAADNKYTLEDGGIRLSNFGDPIGNHRNTSKKYGRAANFTALQRNAVFGMLPAVILPLRERPAKQMTFAVTPDDATVKVTDYAGKAITPAAGVYAVTTADYNYVVEKAGYRTVKGTASITDANEALTTITLSLEAIDPADTGWDGVTTTYEPSQEDGWYIIKSGYHMAWFAAQVNGGNLTAKGKLANDISLDSFDWTPAGGNSNTKAFKGEFDGQGHTIKGLHINATADYQALFGYVQDGAIGNLTVEGSVTTTGKYAAGIAAYLNASTMTNCFNRVTVKGASNLGGIAGYTNGATTIDRCGNEADVEATGNYAGGITANTMNSSVVISNCYNTARITGANYVAGISAHVQQPATFKNVFNTGYISGTGANIGAIRGHKTNGTFENIYAAQAYTIDDEATVKTEIRNELSFAKGEVTAALGDAFGQTIGKDAVPVLGGAKIYLHGDIYLNTEDVPANAVADFENKEGGIQLDETTREWLGADPLNPGRNEWKSGDYTFYTYMDNTWGAAYYYGFYASNQTENTSTGWTEPYRSAIGGAYEGKNFAIWTDDYYSSNSLHLANPLPVKGFYVNNNAYTVHVMATGDGAKKFDETDWLNVVCVGKLAGVTTGLVTVELAKEGKFVRDWTYVDLSALGQVSEVQFYMEGSDSGYYGLNTPKYFCFDNFGAEKPAGYAAPAMFSFVDLPTAVEAAEKAESEEAVRKIMLNGRILILRGNNVYTIDGRKAE